MNNHTIEDILNHLKRGERGHCGFEDDEFSTVIWLEQNSDGMFLYNSSISHKYDVVAPAQYDRRIVNENQLRALLNGLPAEVFNKVSYAYKDVINEKTRDQVNLIYSYLERNPKTLYVVFKEDRWEKTSMRFDGLYRSVEQAEHMIDYLRTRQGAQCYWKAIRLTVNNNELELHGDLSPLDHLNSKQILSTLLDWDPKKIADFLSE